MKSRFENYKFRASSIGHILTNKVSITEKQLIQLNDLKKQQDQGIKPLSITKQKTLDALITKRDAPDKLSAGIKKHLDNVFRSERWGRKRLLFNKFLTKGNEQESDSLQLLSDIEKGNKYFKNNEHLENDYVRGTPDNRQGIIRDIKTNYDMDSFDNAELTPLYEWQIKTYCWLDKKTKGELVYCLVNNPYHQLIDEKNNFYYKLGTPEDTNEQWILIRQQIERNMIFDLEKWKIDNPNADLENKIINKDFDIPKILRVKKFSVELKPEDVKFMKQRVLMAREYLINKEKEINKKIEEYDKSNS